MLLSFKKLNLLSTLFSIKNIVYLRKQYNFSKSNDSICLILSFYKYKFLIILIKHTHFFIIKKSTDLLF